MTTRHRKQHRRRNGLAPSPAKINHALGRALKRPRADAGSLTGEIDGIDSAEWATTRALIRLTAALADAGSAVESGVGRAIAEQFEAVGMAAQDVARQARR